MLITFCALLLHDPLLLQLKDHLQHPVGAGMLRPHVQQEFLRPERRKREEASAPERVAETEEPAGEEPVPSVEVVK